jgi:hypothetical protein
MDFESLDRRTRKGACDVKRLALLSTIILLSLTFLVAGAQWGRAVPQCSTIECLTVLTDSENSDVVAKVIKRALPAIKRAQLAAPRLDNSPGRCQPPLDFPELCAPIVVIRKPSPLARDSVRKHIPALALTIEPRESVVGIPLNAYLRPLPTPFKLSVGGFTLLITLRPSVQWDFGEGDYVADSHLSDLMGDPYPRGAVRHVYRRANLYRVRAEVLWNVSAQTESGEDVEVTGDPIIFTHTSYIRVSTARSHLAS